MNPWTKLANIIKSTRSRADGWASSLFNAGKEESFDPLASELDEAQLERLFRFDARARQIVMAGPWHALRFGYGLSIQDDKGGEQAALILERMAELQALEMVLRAAVVGRLHGGSAIILGTADNEAGDMQAPLNEEGIASIAWLRVASRWRLTVYERNRDHSSAHYLRPEVYQWTPFGGQPKYIHRSRLILFPGAFTTEYTKRNSKGSLGEWDDSVLLAAYQDLRSFGSAMKTLPTLLLNASTTVHKTPRLMELLAGEESDALRTKYAEQHALRSVYGVMVLDKEDEFAEVSRPLGGITDIIDRLMMGVSAASEGMPVTVLFGRSPAGMNATGESDLQSWDAQVSAYRTQILEPRIVSLVRLFMLEQSGPTQGTPPERWDVTWPVLRPPTATQKAEREKMHTERVLATVEDGVILPEEAALILGDPDNEERELRIDLELRRKLLDMEKERVLGEEEQPEPPPMVPQDPEEAEEDEPAEASEEEE